MINMIYEENGILIIEGFEKLQEYKVVSVKPVRSLILIKGTNNPSEKSESWILYPGLYDPIFCEDMIEYFHKKNIKGAGFLCSSDGCYIEAKNYVTEEQLNRDLEENEKNTESVNASQNMFPASNDVIQ